MSDDIVLLAAICLGLSAWVLHLRTKLKHAEEFAYMSLMALRDVADGKLHVTRDKDGDISIKKVKLGEIK